MRNRFLHRPAGGTVTRARHRPYDIVIARTGTWIVSRTGRYRPWHPAMGPALARRRPNQRDTREMVL